MRTPFALLKFLAGAVLRSSGGVLANVARDVWEHWARRGDKARLRAELQALVRAPTREVTQQAERIARRIASGRPETVRQSLTEFLEQTPAAVRRGLRRASDPTGTNVPPSLPLRHADDLLPLLPVRPAHFRPGDIP